MLPVHLLTQWLMIISDYVYYYELGMLLKVENVEIFWQY